MWTLTTSDGQRVADIRSEIDARRTVHMLGVTQLRGPYSWDFFKSDTIQIKVQSPGINASGMWLTFVVYLSLGWASTGRTIGKQVMGLRVARRDGSSLRTGQAIGRAVLCATFPVFMMISVPFSRRNAGIHEMICKTLVVYDWIPETAKRHLPPPLPPPRSRRRRRAASGEVVA